MAETGREGNKKLRGAGRNGQAWLQSFLIQRFKQIRAKQAIAAVASVQQMRRL
jgi:hypothetical protein